MKYSIKKYYESIAKLILISFLFVTILTVFHYHHYNLLGQQSVKQQNQAENNTKFFNDNLQAVCTVLFNYTKLHSVNYSDISYKTFSSNFQGLNYKVSENYYLPSTSKRSHNLRAPPSL